MGEKPVNLLRQKLESAGKWAEFNERCRRLVSDGMERQKAEATALAEIVSNASMNGASTGEVRIPNRSSDGAEIVLWVARNMANPNPSVDECPDQSAWNYLMRCKRAVSLEDDFWKAFMTRMMPARGGMGGTGGGEVDGQSVMDTIAQCKAAHEESVKVTEGAAA